MITTNTDAIKFGYSFFYEEFLNITHKFDGKILLKYALLGRKEKEIDITKKKKVI
jgi:hypothetical protein